MVNNMMEDNNMFEKKKLLTIKEMCEYMSIGKTKARQLLAEPNCPYVFRLGGRIYANKTILDKYIDTNTGRKGL